MRHLTLSEVLWLHERILEQTGGTTGIRDLAALESALLQPRATFAGEDLYPSLGDKAVALGFALIMNHPFMDGNKRTGHASMETFLLLNGYELGADVDEQERTVLAVAEGKVTRAEFTQWLTVHLRPRS
jgi:death on curing protein